MTTFQPGLKDVKVYFRGRALSGVTTGVTRTCQLEGCGARRLGVRWPDGKITYPCTKGMTWNEEERAWEIQ
jgi:hypothetical protein